MAHLHRRKRSRVQTWIQIPNPMATLYYPEHFTLHRLKSLVPTPYFCIVQESESESMPESVSGNVNEALDVRADNTLFLNPASGKLFEPLTSSAYSLLIHTCVHVCFMDGSCVHRTL